MLLKAMADYIAMRGKMRTGDTVMLLLVQGHFILYGKMYVQKFLKASVMRHCQSWARHISLLWTL